MPPHLSAPGPAARRSKLKRKALASEMERLAVDSGWLPLMQRAMKQEAQEDVDPVAD